MPASTRARIRSTVFEAGPSVQTILVRRIRTSVHSAAHQRPIRMEPVGHRPSRPERVQPFPLVPYLYYLAIFVVSALFAGALPQPARADAIVSGRNFLELGKRNADAGDEFIVGLGLVADVLFGAPKPKTFRIGPAIELRTVDFASLEAAAGAAISIPLPAEFAIGLYGLVGAAARKHAPDGMVGIGKVTMGFRGYPYKGGWYGYGLNLYGSGRKHIGDEELVEWTGGVEVDVMFTALIPLLSIKNFMSGDDPFEPGKHRAEEEEEESASEEPAEAEETPRKPADDEEEEVESEAPEESEESEDD